MDFKISSDWIILIKSATRNKNNRKSGPHAQKTHKRNQKKCEGKVMEGQIAEKKY